MTGLLDYQPGDSPLHRAHPLVKLLLAVTLCVGGFLANAIWINVVILAIIIIGGILCGMARQVKATLKGIGSLCAVLFILQLPFITSGWVLVNLPLGMKITYDGLRFCTQLCLRLIGATLPLVVLFGVTRLSDLTNALVSQLGIPYRFAFVLTTAIRFIPVLLNEMRDTIEAQTARGVELDVGVIQKIKLIPPLCVPLLVSCVQRMENNALAAELRGFYFRTRKSGYRQYPLKITDVAWIVGCIILIIISAIL
ncbi:ABC transporter permease [Clostridia bacterium]|nr:ABC transporter permease [Clostridia bacterium]